MGHGHFVDVGIGGIPIRRDEELGHALSLSLRLMGVKHVLEPYRTKPRAITKGFRESFLRDRDDS
ncbi:hypothetical protein NSI01_20360 [Pimelobacter simplex]|nr:hypothetical protein NSI01_20360 [Pimelobacter simplex]